MPGLQEAGLYGALEADPDSLEVGLTIQEMETDVALKEGTHSPEAEPREVGPKVQEAETDSRETGPLSLEEPYSLNEEQRFLKVEILGYLPCYDLLNVRIWHHRGLCFLFEERSIHLGYLQLFCSLILSSDSCSDGFLL